MTVLPALFRRFILVGFLSLALLLAILADGQAASAAEVLQIRTGTLLQVGDSNRSYSVRLGCLELKPGSEDVALAWVRRHAPRGTRVNLRPMGEAHGELVAHVTVVPRRGGGEPIDLGASLVTEGLASPVDGCRPA